MAAFTESGAVTEVHAALLKISAPHFYHCSSKGAGSPWRKQSWEVGEDHWESIFIASQGESQPWSSYLRDQILSNFSVIWQPLEKTKIIKQSVLAQNQALDKLAILQGTILLIADNYILRFYIRPAVLKVPVPLVRFPFFNGLGIKPQTIRSLFLCWKKFHVWSLKLTG